MLKINWKIFVALGSFLLIILFFAMLQNKPAISATGGPNNYVVTTDVAFVRSAADEPLIFEDYSIDELNQKMQPDEIYSKTYYIYGNNVAGKVDSKNNVLEIKYQKNGKEETGYISRSKLWQEPELTKLEAPRYLCSKDTAHVYLTADKKSRKVMLLYKGEVVDVAGSVKGWVKAKFDKNRFGYIQASDATALVPGKVDESNLNLSEIPKTMRDSDIILSGADRAKLAQNGFFIEKPTPAEYSIYVDDMVDDYKTYKHGKQFFITSDLYLHSFHLIFDRMLQKIEEKKLNPFMGEMAKKLVLQAEKELKQAKAASYPENIL
ncbi:MAG: DUF3160 domain-containing protein, partial [Candidatus Margulisiibacteriota bacterium]